uniref:NRF domain-containing protein n=1 Tax=Globodera pallida TaxID=36090 RepID=A0A183BTD0_GLOPA
MSDGNYHWLGDYEQCQRLRTDGLFNGQYCLLEFLVPDGVLLNAGQCADSLQPLEVVLGICLPANCEQHETRGLLEYVAEHQPIQVRCSPSRALPFPAVLLLAVCLLWLSLVFAVSLARWFRPSLSLPRPLTALSLQTHLRHALRTIRPPQAPFQAVQGLQCVSAAMLVFGYAQVWVMPFLENIGHHYGAVFRGSHIGSTTFSRKKTSPGMCREREGQKKIKSKSFEDKEF